MYSYSTTFYETNSSTEVLHLAKNFSTKVESNDIVKIKTDTGYISKLVNKLYVPDLKSNLLSVAN